VIEKKVVEVAVRGRGGQGAKTCGDLITYALHEEGMKPHGQPRYTPDRMGAPVSYAIRYHLDRSPCSDRSWIKDPEYVVLFDLSLVEQLDLIPSWKPGIQLIVNGRTGDPRLRMFRDFDLYIVDASTIAREVGLMKGSVPILSSVMGGAFARASELVTIDTLKECVRQQAVGKLSRFLSANIEALERGYTEVRKALELIYA